MTDRTLALVKPAAVAAGAVGPILDMIDQAGLRVCALKMVRLTPAQAAGFYAVHLGRPFYDGLVTMMASGPVVAAVLEGEEAVHRWRELMGPTDPSMAPAGTVRHRFGQSVRENAVHGSDSLESAVDEIRFFFSQMEMCQEGGCGVD